MTDSSKSLDRLLHDLRERAKELNCLYELQELLNTKDISAEEICQGILQIIPPGWQYPDVCQVEVEYSGRIFQSPGFEPSPWVQSAEIVVQDQVVGKISIYYTEERPPSDEGPFLKEERRLIDTIAEQFGFFILHEQLKQVFQQQLSDGAESETWTALLDLLKRTDPDLLIRLSRKMIYLLGMNGIEETEELLERVSSFHVGDTELDENRPSQGPTTSSLLEFSDDVFSIASKHLSRDEILDNIQKWSREDRLRFFVNVLVNPSSSLAEITSAIERYHLLTEQGIELAESREKWFRIALIRRLLSDQPDFVRVAKQFIKIDDFTNFMRQVIFPAGSHGKLGGKSSGLFLAS
ncbi:MAG: GAF domain-containing protein, partial [Anaerolineales bacterium]